MSKIINTRIQYKADTEANWNSSSFISQPGEIYEYLPDSNYEFSRLKIGDGVRTVSRLPFTEVGEIGADTDTPDLISVKLPEAAFENEAVYTGSEVIPMWADVEQNDDQYWADHTDANKITISGQTSGITAGTYTANFTPNDGYCWEDGTTETKAVEWTIQKATPDLTLMSITNGESSETNFNVAVGGNFRLVAEYPSYVVDPENNIDFSFTNGTGSVEPVFLGVNKYLINGVSAGSATATVTLLATDNYKSVSKTVTINVTECQHDGGSYYKDSQYGALACEQQRVEFCSLCDAQLNVEIFHDPTEVQGTYIPGGCEADSAQEYVCADCGQYIRIEYYPAPGHNYEVQPGSPWYGDEGPDGIPTTENWDYVCSNCGDSYTNTIPI